MTNEELEAIRDMHPNALNVWNDRMFEMPVIQLVETILAWMPAGDLLAIIYKIEADIKESLDDDNGPTDPA